jgi:hypothetical protein
LMKYIWGLAGLVIVAWPILTGVESVSYHSSCVIIVVIMIRMVVMAVHLLVKGPKCIPHPGVY